MNVWVPNASYSISLLTFNCFIVLILIFIKILQLNYSEYMYMHTFINYYVANSLYQATTYYIHA